jgi:hypothetical protein
MTFNELDVVFGVQSEEVGLEVGETICPAAWAHLFEWRFQEPFPDACTTEQSLASLTAHWDCCDMEANHACHFLEDALQLLGIDNSALVDHFRSWFAV